MTLKYFITFYGAGIQSGQNKMECYDKWLYHNGGLKNLRSEAFRKSLKTTAIKQYFEQGNQEKWKAFLELELRPYGKDTKT